jgi:hypothetical protein
VNRPRHASDRSLQRSSRSRDDNDESRRVIRETIAFIERHPRAAAK